MKLLPIIISLATAACGRTTRYQIVTRDDGTKEILSNQIGVTPSTDLKFLAQDLNASVTKLEPSAAPSTEESVTDHIIELASLEKQDPTPLLNQLNSYTANGWTNQQNAVYANSTKLVIFNDGSDSHENHHLLLKKGRSENLTEETLPSKLTAEDYGMWEVIEHLYDCFSNATNHGGSMQCLKDRVTTIFYRYLDDSLNRNFRGGEEKALLHGKKLLKGALLPLLVFLIIKYLIALPVLAAGLVTIKTFWLSLLSAGVAAFGAPWKHQHSVIKRYRPDGEAAWSPPPWVMALHSNDALSKMGNANPVTDKYFM